eukprot:TRINITY_DN2029_c1_g1_i2.p1 TRINITY_DN2029_c1_g1~~TRINITY_DN2029_c1_g1_i2.p1  ORF type:complete len:459 (+),score=33.79 TRINITY_DN2029_c1_g1_i2:80-1456(+)
MRARAMGAILWLFPTVLGAPYRFRRSAALFFGKVPRDLKNGPEDILLFEGLVRPSIEASVLRPFAVAAESVDVLVHTWESRDPSITARLRAPLGRMGRGINTQGTVAVRIDKPLSEEELRAKAPWWSPYHVAQVPGLLSMERAVGMASHYENKVHKEPYHLMLLMRLDLVFFRPFSFHSLEVGRFYIANWCLARGAERGAPERNIICRALVPFHRELRASIGGLVPDFYFLSSGANMKNVFGNITGLAGSPRFFQTAPTLVGHIMLSRCSKTVRRHCCKQSPRNCRRPINLHGAMLPLLRGWNLVGSVRRYLWHHLDFTFARSFQQGWQLTWETFHCAEHGGGWLTPPTDTSSLPPVSPQRSYCPTEAAYCFCPAALGAPAGLSDQDPKSGRRYGLCRGKGGGAEQCSEEAYMLGKELAHHVHSREQPAPNVTSRVLRKAIALARLALAAANASQQGA